MPKHIENSTIIRGNSAIGSRLLKDSKNSIFSHTIYEMVVIGCRLIGNPKIVTSYFWLATYYILLKATFPP